MKRENEMKSTVNDLDNNINNILTSLVSQLQDLHILVFNTISISIDVPSTTSRSLFPTNTAILRNTLCYS